METLPPLVVKLVGEGGVETADGSPCWKCSQPTEGVHYKVKVTLHGVPVDDLVVCAECVNSVEEESCR